MRASLVRRDAVHPERNNTRLGTESLGGRIVGLPIELKIPLPGAPVRVELRDPSGAPVAGCRLTIPQQGPLAVLWPAAWLSDATGRIEIPTLGAGTNTVQIDGMANPVLVEVPPAPASPVIVALTVPSRR